MALRAGSGDYQFAQEVTLDPSSINANSVSVETYTVTGVNLDTKYEVDALSLEAGLFVIESHPTAANTLAISIWNTTNAAVNPAAQKFRVLGL